MFNTQYSMKKYLLIFIAFFLIISSYAQSIPKWKITDVEEYIKKSETPVIVNFWATYCIPCIEEIPYFQELVKKYENKGVKLLLISLDFEDFYPSRIKKFADKQKFTAPIVWLDETNADYFCPKIDSAWSGVMPATLFVNNKSGFRSFFEEQIPREHLEAEILKLIEH